MAKKSDDEVQPDPRSPEGLAAIHEDGAAKEREQLAKNDPREKFIDRGENGVGDLTKAVEVSNRELVNPERTEDGAVVTNSPAAAAVNDELSRRAVGGGEGGGRWPHEVLARRYLATDAQY